jgi:hypothetical protein
MAGPPDLSRIEAGGMGGAPDGAPTEVSQPLQPAALQEMAEKARANEQTLEPLVFPQAKAGQADATSAASVATGAEPQLDPYYQRLKDLARSTPSSPSSPSRPDPAQPAQPYQPAASDTDSPSRGVPRGTPDDLAAHQPARSDTDSPSRGIPRGVSDPGKAITGGFGDPGEMAYFALTGEELRELVLSLMDQIAARLANDLRFSLAVTYPRVQATVEISITGFAEDYHFQIARALPDQHEARTKTPLELARAVADEICFVMIAAARETSDTGESVKPPDQIRAELQLPRPRKHTIAIGGGRVLADI